MSAFSLFSQPHFFFMKVTIDPDSGFCFGVNKAIQTAEKELDRGSVVYSLGEMVHNQIQMDMLKAKGLKVITHQDLPSMAGKTVMIRAHGEPPETFRLAEQLNVKLINATCPIVSKLQEKIREVVDNESSDEVQIVIFGKPGHAEVVGLSGNAGLHPIIIFDESGLNNIDFNKPVRLFSQTTMDGERYTQLADLIKLKMAESGNSDFRYLASVCKQVSGRAPALRLFAQSNEVVLFVSGKNSANGAYLFEVCKRENPKTYFISSTNDIDMHWFTHNSRVGVTGATSTPSWLINEVAAFLST